MSARLGADADRPAAIRAALRQLVAEEGFHGASMSKVARRAGVATGTAYVHYASKDDLVLATYVEAKHALGAAAVAAAGDEQDLRSRFIALWRGAHRHLAARPGTARFLLQVDVGPYGAAAHDAVVAAGDDPLVLDLARTGLGALADHLPPLVAYELGLAPAVRLVARGVELGDAEVDRVAAACWTAVTTR